MARKKKNIKANGDIKYAGIRFNPDTYVEIGANLEDFSNSTVTSDINGVVTQYSLGGGGLVAEPLEVTTNGEYQADEGKAYNPVTVNVPAYSEELLWTNESPSTGFNFDKIMGDFNPYNDNYDYYKIVYTFINNSADTGVIFIRKYDLVELNQAHTMSSTNETGDVFARAITYEVVEITSDPPLYEGRLLAKGLCSQIGANNVKKFRCIPYQVYGVSIG